MLNRREFFAAAGAASLAAAAPSPAALRIGAMDGVLQLASRPEAAAKAAALGIHGMQVTLGQNGEKSRLLLEDAALQRAWAAAADAAGVTLNATYIDMLHVNCLKRDAKAAEFVARGIAATKAIGAPILMTVFFGQCELMTRAETDAALDAFRELTQEAARAKIVLGFENVLLADENVRAHDRIASPYFKIYYDVGNLTNMKGQDAAAEIRQLGRERICQFHFKDKGYLGEGKVNFPAVLAAIRDTGFQGWANLETGAPSGDAAADTRRNLKYLQDLLRKQEL
jgi:sugar phosphate isomerase/epimerase